MTFEQIAAMLGAEGVNWAIDRLRRYRPLVGYHAKGYDDSWDRLALEGAFNLETWLSMEAKAHEMIGEDCPEIEDASTALYQVLPLIAQYIARLRAT
jgi:hypothetical protein